MTARKMAELGMTALAMVHIDVVVLTFTKV